MSWDFKSVINVYYTDGAKELEVGRLAFIPENKKIVFEYSNDFIQSGLQLSPFKLPLKKGVIVSQDIVFEGLFGLFNDSIPDGWGRMLLDRKLMALGMNPEQLTPLDRLRFVGFHGMGALRYRPEMEGKSHEVKIFDLDTLANECLEFELHNEDQYIEDLMVLNGSSQGARPKILVSLNTDLNQLEMSDNIVSHPHHDWIIKLRSSLDPLDSGPIEYAYHLMAKQASLIVPEAKLFKSKNGFGYFGVKRFDRNNHQFIHTHTLSGLLHADHRLPCMDYSSILKATQILTKNYQQLLIQYRNAVFNVLSHNRDDHAKNFSFIMDSQDVWKVSPAYDLNFSNGPAGQHCTSIMGNGKNPSQKDLLKLAESVGIEQTLALNIVSEVKDSVSNWNKHAKKAGVSERSLQYIQKQLDSL